MRFSEQTLLIAATTLGLVFATSCSRDPSYKTFEDCILSEVRASQTPAAVRAIQAACRSKFPPSAAELAAQRKAERDVGDAAQAQMDAAEGAAVAAAAAADAAVAADASARE